jgi:putative DNA primase/helicase
MMLHAELDDRGNILSSPVQMALTLFRNGHHPLWLNFGTKVPGRTGWLNNLPTEESLSRDFKRPGNIALIQGVPAADKTFAVTIDLDRDDGALIAYVEATIAADCPKKRGKKGLSFLVRGIGEINSQTLHDYRDGKKPAGDILAKGKMTVIPPSIHPETHAPYEWWGKRTPFNTRFEELPLIDDSVIKEIRVYLKDTQNPIAQLNHMTWKGVGGRGDTHDTCVAAVGRMVHDAWTDDQIHARIRRAKREASERAGEPYDWPGEMKAAQEWIDSAREKAFGGKRASSPSHGELANLVLSKHGSIIKRDKARHDWCVYNGKFWEEGATEDVKALIRQCLPDDQVFKFTIDGIEGVMRLYPQVGVKGDVWDPDKAYLNCPDGTCDLRTGEMLPHDPAHLITKITQVSPRFDYQDSLWVKLISAWFDQNEVEIEYIHRFFGLCLTGETKDECVALWLGKSGAGKTKMTEIVGYVMGDYAQTATDTAFLEVRYHPHLEEIARMRGKRVVFIHEVEGYLNLRRVKSIASGEVTSASFKGKDSFQFKPEAKIWFVGNEFPPTKSAGRELQRRFHVYEFVRQIDEKDIDINLGEKLRAEAGFVLGWMIDGAVKYYKHGLQRSPHVVASTKRYFSEADILEQWIDEHCIVDPDAIETVLSLFENFDFWADSARIKAKPDKGRFSQRLKAKGYQLERRTVITGNPAVRVIRGLKLRSPDQMPSRAEERDTDRY